jgi:hypothetical protein
MSLKSPPGRNRKAIANPRPPFREANPHSSHVHFLFFQETKRKRKTLRLAPAYRASAAAKTASKAPTAGPATDAALSVELGTDEDPVAVEPAPEPDSSPVSVSVSEAPLLVLVAVPLDAGVVKTFPGVVKTFPGVVAVLVTLTVVATMVLGVVGVVATAEAE